MLLLRTDHEEHVESRDCVHADMDFDLDEVLMTLLASGSDEDRVPVDGKLLSTSFFISYFHAPLLAVL